VWTALHPPDQLYPGDAVVLQVFESPTTRQPCIDVMDVVDDDGTVALLSNQVFTATGKTYSELEKEVADYYAPRYFKNATIRLYTTDPPMYFVRGKVKSPGAWTRKRSTTVPRAIQSAGGFTEFANKSKVQLNRGDHRYVINCLKAQQDPSLDMSVLGADQIFVPRSFWKW
jgi:protein involved in polysaccharide export with SLBB domain